MTPFIVPIDSLSRRYDQAHRRFAWERVRTPAGAKVLPKVRTQTGPTCIYEAVVGWMESHLRLRGITTRLSALDLQRKEQECTVDETDRTIRCIKVISSVGVRSEDDYYNEKWDGIVYKAVGCKAFYSLNKQGIGEATDRMGKGPLLLVFHCGKNYFDYIFTFKQRPVLSYERYEQGKMLTHAVNTIGYGVETIVPNWIYMNSYGKFGRTKGIGRVLPQNAIYLCGMDTVIEGYAEEPAVAIILRKKTRRWEFTDGDDDEDPKPPLKKQRLEIVDYMDVDIVLLHPP